MAINTYDLGDLVKVKAPFSVVATGDAIDPEAVNLTVTKPDGTATTSTYGVGDTIINDAPGSYYAVIDADQSGDWHYRWWSSGDGQAAEKRRFVVRPG